MPSGAVAAVLARASSLGDQMNPYTPKRNTSYEYRKPPSEKGTPPRTRASGPADSSSLIFDTLSTPLESGDGTSLDSGGGSPTEERVNMPWTTDSEELEREVSPFFIRDFTIEEALLEEAQHEEAMEETAEVSFITSVFNYMYTDQP